MTEFCLAPEDWPRLEALKDEPVYIDHDTPGEYSNAMRCGMVRVILGDFDLRGHHVHALALTPAGYAMLAERERWLGCLADAFASYCEANPDADHLPEPWVEEAQRVLGSDRANAIYAKAVLP